MQLDIMESPFIKRLSLSIKQSVIAMANLLERKIGFTF